MIGYYLEEELNGLGFKNIGKNVKISRTSTIYNAQGISIGSNVRIDNFCVLAISGNASIFIGNHVHISAYCFFNGLADIELNNFVTLAPYVRLFSSTDDYSGEFMTGATLRKEYLGTFSNKITLNKHCIIGTGSTILPGINLGMGTAVGAHSLVKNSFGDFSIIAGVPAKLIKMRSKKIIELEERFLNEGNYCGK